MTSVIPNIVDSEWVIRIKRMPDGSLAVKARSCIRGFKDGPIEMLDTFAGTASRYGQRAVNNLAATKWWLLWNFDVSRAILKGLAFEEVSKMTGTPSVRAAGASQGCGGYPAEASRL